MFNFRAMQIEITMRSFSAIRLAKVYCESVSSAREDVGKWVHLFKSKGNRNCLRFFGVHSRNSHDNVKLHILFDLALSPLEMQLTKIKTLVPKNIYMVVIQMFTVTRHQMPSRSKQMDNTCVMKPLKIMNQSYARIKEISSRC